MIGSGHPRRLGPVRAVQWRTDASGVPGRSRTRPRRHRRPAGVGAWSWEGVGDVASEFLESHGSRRARPGDRIGLARAGRIGGGREAPRADARGVAPLAGVQPARKVHGRQPEALPRGGLRRDRRTRLRLRPAAAGLPLLDRPGRLDPAPRGLAAGDRRGGAVRREARRPRPAQLPPRPRVHRRQPTGAQRPLDRPRGAGRLCPALGALRPPLPGRPEFAAELQPVQRAEQGRRGGAPGGRRADGGGDPGPGQGPADRLRRARLRHHPAGGVGRAAAWRRRRAGTRRST